MLRRPKCDKKIYLYKALCEYALCKFDKAEESAL